MVATTVPPGETATGIRLDEVMGMFVCVVVVRLTIDRKVVMDDGRQTDAMMIFDVVEKTPTFLDSNLSDDDRNAIFFINWLFFFVLSRCSFYNRKPK